MRHVLGGIASRVDGASSAGRRSVAITRYSLVRPEELTEEEPRQDRIADRRQQITRANSERRRVRVVAFGAGYVNGVPKRSAEATSDSALRCFCPLTGRAGYPKGRTASTS